MPGLAAICPAVETNPSSMWSMLSASTENRRISRQEGPGRGPCTRCVAIAKCCHNRGRAHRGEGRVVGRRGRMPKADVDRTGAPADEAVWTSSISTDYYGTDEGGQSWGRATCQRFMAGETVGGGDLTCEPHDTLPEKKKTEVPQMFSHDLSKALDEARWEVSEDDLKCQSASCPRPAHTLLVEADLNTTATLSGQVIDKLCLFVTIRNLNRYFFLWTCQML